MPTTPTLCHLTWQATDLQRTRAFLETMFDWNFEAVGDNYLVFKAPSGAWIGLTEVPQVHPGNAFVPQVAVADLSELLGRVRQLGDGIVAGGRGNPRRWPICRSKGPGWYNVFGYSVPTPRLMATTSLRVMIAPGFR
jgi:predicted enzyme related to lactoylglutathione lyase